MNKIMRHIGIAVATTLMISTMHAAQPKKKIESEKPELPLVLANLNIKLLKPIKGISRTFKELDTDYANRLTSVMIIMKERHGYDMTILESYRSPQRQDSLSPEVTQVRGSQSFHQYGLAADTAFIKNGKLMVSPKDPWTMKGYNLLGEVSKSVGLVWGGNWTLKDYGHTELRTPKAMLAMSIARRSNYRLASL